MKRYAGTWLIARTIVDRDRATQIDCTGSARLRTLERDATLSYDETVSFQLGGKTIHATRAYRFVSSDDGAIRATFSDGSPFFTVQPNAEGIGTAIHHCGDDTYTLTLTLRESTTWETRWDIGGTKRMHIVTCYTR